MSTKNRARPNATYKGQPVRVLAHNSTHALIKHPSGGCEIVKRTALSPFTPRSRRK